MTTPDDPFGHPVQQPAAGGQQPFQGQPYAALGYEAGYGAPVVAARNGFGTAALVLGILAIPGAFTVVGGVLLGILAIIFGAIGRSRAKRGLATNGGIALAGLITGAVGLVLAVAFVAIGVGLLNSGSGQKLRDCIDQAGADRTAQQVCQDQLRDTLTH